MVAFSRLALGTALLGSALATPWPESIKHATHRKREMFNGAKVTAFHPASQFEVSILVHTQ